MPLKIIITGATGMVGQAALLECLDSEHVESVLAVTRRPTGRQHEKLTELIVKDFFNLNHIKDKLQNYDTCFFCLGAPPGLSAKAYTKVTYDLTLHFARTLADINPDLCFCYVSGAGSDQHSRIMWLRIKGETEAALLKLSFKRIYLFRPGYIQPLKGIKSSNPLTRIILATTYYFYGVIKILLPNCNTTSERLGSAMIAAVHKGWHNPFIESNDINLLAK